MELEFDPSDDAATAAAVDEFLFRIRRWHTADLMSMRLRETAWTLAYRDHQTRQRGEESAARGWVRKVPYGLNGRMQEQYFGELQRLTDWSRLAIDCADDQRPIETDPDENDSDPKSE